MMEKTMDEQPFAQYQTLSWDASSQRVRVNGQGLVDGPLIDAANAVAAAGYRLVTVDAGVWVFTHDPTIPVAVREGLNKPDPSTLTNPVSETDDEAPPA